FGDLEPADAIGQLRNHHVAGVGRLSETWGAFTRLAILETCSQSLRHLFASALVKEAGVRGTERTHEIAHQRREILVADRLNKTTSLFLHRGPPSLLVETRIEVLALKAYQATVIQQQAAEEAAAERFFKWTPATADGQSFQPGWQ